MKHNPDNRNDNVENIQFNIDNTIENIGLAEEMISKTDDPKTKADLEDKNQRRRAALQGMRREIKEEVAYREHK